MKTFVMIHDLVNPATGKTIKEENLEKMHSIPIGTLVEVKWSEWYGGGACAKNHARLWVVKHTRDCDGTPLYMISQWRDPTFGIALDAHHGFGEESLIPIERTEAVLNGEDILKWPDDE